MFGRWFGGGKPDGGFPVITDVLTTGEAMAHPDPAAMVTLNVTVTNHFLVQYCYDIPELAPESIESYSVDYYLAQVQNGGHEQFACNAHNTPNTWKFARSGLAAMGATEHLRAFESFAAIIRRDDARARDLIARGGFGEVDSDVEDIDNAFFAANAAAPLAELNGRWLRSLPNLHILPQSEMEAFIEGFGSHPAVRARLKWR